MAHVQIAFNEDGTGSVVVDGFDMTPHVLADGFGVEFNDGPGGRPVVHLRVIADTLDIDLSSAAVEVLH